MTQQQLNSKKYIIDYLTNEERADTIISSAIQSLIQLQNSEYFPCNNPRDIGAALDSIIEDDVIIHFLAHGGNFGIARVTDQYYVQIIHWELLLKSFERIQSQCNSLSINLMAVCNSHLITEYKSKPYDMIWTTSSNTNSIESSLRIYSERNFAMIISLFDNSERFHQTIGQR
ncbi:hypothetical protein [Flavobacterium columnare]|uniref:Uncharacterized protein n=1 Tax=Flavobacterium columnare TaxID=996 RepID=A0AA94F2Z7_9FLAO|nr:hypothetical protein [Flavobacterium columnare]MCH4828740.1 hypothetical protein [Flavobacterium columnare]MCH4831994.1 hypothetical protein [Flavobacterium columnare]